MLKRNTMLEFSQDLETSLWISMCPLGHRPRELSWGWRVRRQSGTGPQAVTTSRLHPPCHPVPCSALGLLLDWLAGACPGQAVIKFLGHGPVLLLARTLVFKMDSWSIMSGTAQGRFKDFLGQWARTRYRGEAQGAGGRWQPCRLLQKGRGPRELLWAPRHSTCTGFSARVMGCWEDLSPRGVLQV